MCAFLDKLFNVTFMCLFFEHSLNSIRVYNEYMMCMFICFDPFFHKTTVAYAHYSNKCNK